MSFPVIPDNAPFSPEQRSWLNGFLAGMFSRTGAPAAAMAAPAPTLKPLTILWGSQTGTAEGLAKQAAKEAGKQGFAATVLDMAELKPDQLSSHTNLLVITSTYGDGEPPDNAKALHTAISSDSMSKLSGINFSVCSLGDTNYTLFCQCGKDFDTKLEKLGANRVTSRVDCDLDYEEPFQKWLDETLAAFANATPSSAEGAIPIDTAPPVKAETTVEGFSKKNPFPAPVLTVRNLNGPGSAKEVNHVEFSLEGSGLTYEAGDALGVIPQNCPDLVEQVIKALGCDGEEAVNTPVGELPLRHALTIHFDLGKPMPSLLAELGLQAGPGIVDVLDALQAASSEKRAAIKTALTSGGQPFKKLQPRLYSISSSPKAHPGQVHLTVGAVRYEVDGRKRKGVCSTFLAERAQGVGKVGVFVHHNKAFRPPADGNIPVIMVGPGTGIAPFRAFLEERKATASKGKNWLFFGDQKSACDFLYQEELSALKDSGLLTRLDTAFSRDQAEKIYVQNRMIENAAEIFAWLEAGAHFYVCGDASRMAKDVDVALHQIIQIAGGKTFEEAASYVQSLRTAKRYQRDVY